MRNKTKNPKESFTKFLLPATVIVLVLGFCALGSAVVHLMHQDKLRDNQYLAYLIVRSVDSLNQPLVTEALSGKEYIPPARLVLPPTVSTLGRVVYAYEPAGTGLSESVNLASSSSIITAEGALLSSGENTNALFDAAPKLQACARGVQIAFAEQSGQTVAASKKLANGRTVYFYMNPSCQNASLLQYAEQVDSY